MRISDWSSDVCSSDLSGGWSCFGNKRIVGTLFANRVAKERCNGGAVQLRFGSILFQKARHAFSDFRVISGRIGGVLRWYGTCRRAHGAGPMDGNSQVRCVGGGVCDSRVAARQAARAGPENPRNIGQGHDDPNRTEERRVGKEWVRTGSYRGSRDQKKKK